MTEPDYKRKIELDEYNKIIYTSVNTTNFIGILILSRAVEGLAL
jgi:hypothetical protein